MYKTTDVVLIRRIFRYLLVTVDDKSPWLPTTLGLRANDEASLLAAASNTDTITNPIVFSFPTFREVYNESAARV
jgi:hypothetical protein